MSRPWQQRERDCSSHRSTVFIVRLHYHGHTLVFLGMTLTRVTRLQEEEEEKEEKEKQEKEDKKTKRRRRKRQLVLNIACDIFTQTFPLLVLCCLVKDTADINTT